MAAEGMKDEVQLLLRPVWHKSVHKVAGCAHPAAWPQEGVIVHAVVACKPCNNLSCGPARICCAYVCHEPYIIPVMTPIVSALLILLPYFKMHNSIIYDAIISQNARLKDPRPESHPSLASAGRLGGRQICSLRHSQSCLQADDCRSCRGPLSHQGPLVCPE